MWKIKDWHLILLDIGTADLFDTKYIDNASPLRCNRMAYGYMLYWNGLYIIDIFPNPSESNIT
jgi:hypothetical protein